MTTLVKKAAITTTQPTVANQVVYDFFDISDAEDVNGKKIKVRNLTERVSIEQLIARKKSYADEIVKVDAKIAKINALP